MYRFQFNRTSLKVPLPFVGHCDNAFNTSSVKFDSTGLGSITHSGRISGGHTIGFDEHPLNSRSRASIDVLIKLFIFFGQLLNGCIARQDGFLLGCLLSKKRVTL